MILVETDCGAEWGPGADWAKLADDAVRAAIGASGRASLLDGDVAVEISVKFADNGEVRALNGAWRGRDEATNVLSFPMLDAETLAGPGAAGAGELLLGDIILARGVCAREAEDKGVDIADHAAHLIVHGTLHLLGYDHETGEDEAEAMEVTERRALASIGIVDPYPVQEVQS